MIVWERGGRWAAWSRLAVGGLGEPIVEVRTLADCWQAFVARPSQGVLIECRPDRWPVLLEAVHRMAAWGSGPKCLIAVGGPELAVAQVALVEAGVIYVATSPRDLPQVAGLLDRHRQQGIQSRNLFTKQGRGERHDGSAVGGH